MSRAFYKNSLAALLIGTVLLLVFTSLVSSAAPQWAADGPAKWRVFDQHAIETSLQVARGNFVDTVGINIFGRNPDISTATAEDIWETGGDYTFPVAAEAVTLVSDSIEDDAVAVGAGAWAIIVYGLDANFDMAEETILLDGLTPVTTTQTFIRVHQAIAATAGSSGSNVGNITATQAVTTSTVLFTMPAVYGRTNLGVFTVPRSHTLLLTRLYGTVARAQATLAAISLRARVANIPNGAFQVFGDAGIASAGSSWVSVSYTNPNTIGEYTDLILGASVSAPNTDVNAGFSGYLIDNR